MEVLREMSWLFYGGVLRKRSAVNYIKLYYYFSFFLIANNTYNTILTFQSTCSNNTNCTFHNLIVYVFSYKFVLNVLHRYC